MNPKQEPVYCYWDIRSQTDFWVAIGNLCCAFAIGIFLLHAYRRSNQYLKPGDFKKIYALLALWWIAYTLEYSFSVMVYWLKFKDKKEVINGEDILNYSRAFEVMDFFGAFFLLASMLFISFSVIGGIHNLCSKKELLSTKFELYSYLFLKYYQFIRALFFIPTFTLLLQDNDHSLRICSTIEVSFFILDTLTTLIILIITAKTVKKKNKQAGISNEKDDKKLKRETITLVFILITRLLLGIFFILSPLIFDKQIHQAQECPVSNSQEHLIRTIVYLIFGQMIMHFIPVIFMVKMFKISKREYETATLLLSDDDLSSKNESEKSIRT